MTDYFKSLLDNPDKLMTNKSNEEVVTKPVKVKPINQHPCHECAGTGKVKTQAYGRHGIRYDRTCPACKGKGHFKQSPEQRQRAKQKRASKKIVSRLEIEAAFNEQHPGLISRLMEIVSWHQFAQSLVEGYKKYGSLTDKQVTAGWAALARVEAKKAEREKIKQAASTVQLVNIVTMFAAAKSNGMKKPMFRADGIVISQAPDSGKNAGALYVKHNQEYSGKIVDGVWFPTNRAHEDLLNRLQEIEGNPKEVALTYGRRTGKCACCGRLLTKHGSIEAGIGPVCAGRWGF